MTELKEKVPDRNIRNVLKRVEKRSDSAGTYRTRRNCLGEYARWLDSEGLSVTEADHHDIESYLFWLDDEDYASSTISNRFDNVIFLYNQLVDWFELMEENPAEKISRRDYAILSRDSKKKTISGDSIIYVTPEEVDQLAANVPKPKTRNRLLIRLMFQTGVRVGEVIRIKIDNVNRDGRAIHVYAPKTDDWRWVYYQQDLDSLMTIYLEEYRPIRTPAKDSEHLFISYESPRLQTKAVNMVVKKAAENAGIQEVLYESNVDGQIRYRITSHALRHGHCIEAAKSGIDVKRIADHCGHEDITTTQKYLDYVDEDVREAYHGKFGKHA